MTVECLSSHIRGDRHQHNKDSWTWVKDAFVCLSFTVDLTSTCVSNYFEDAVIASAKKACLEEWAPGRDLSSFLEPFWRTLLVTDDVRVFGHHVLKNMAMMEDIEAVDFRILKSLHKICEFLTSSDLEQGAGDALAEADYVQLWKTLFSIFLSQSSVYSRAGERILSSSRQVLEMLDEEIADISTTGRKADLTFKSKDLELANFEFKSHDKPETCLQLQHRKNLRLNRAIMEQLRDCHLEEPRLAFADFEDLLNDGALFKALIALTDHAKKTDQIVQERMMTMQGDRKRSKLSPGLEDPEEPQVEEETSSENSLKDGLGK
ncbi:hypothetical protein BG006_009120 [Podila minutissima]|uniref:Uncharacterized protein n=1 Tax=Podila minutissima TaxID=64525 RepID=A0A9P5VJI7_9FUNG|nr:hypothetical protein BG006_009120 [Podila minutissima]